MWFNLTLIQAKWNRSLGRFSQPPRSPFSLLFRKSPPSPFWFGRNGLPLPIYSQNPLLSPICKNCSVSLVLSFARNEIPEPSLSVRTPLRPNPSLPSLSSQFTKIPGSVTPLYSQEAPTTEPPSWLPSLVHTSSPRIDVHCSSPRFACSGRFPPSVASSALADVIDFSILGNLFYILFIFSLSYQWLKFMRRVSFFEIKVVLK